jgi:flagellar biosynthesis protein FlhG
MNKNSPIHVIAITSGKGGVGKTHTTLNLGLALQQLGHRVLILDADLGLANINVLLGFEPAKTVAKVLAGEARIDEILVHDESGVDIIPASSGIPELTRLSDGERLHLVESLDQLAEDYDFMLIDTAAGIGDNVLYFSVAAEETVVVINHEPTSITDAYAVIKVLSTRHSVKKFSIIINSLPGGVEPRVPYAQLAAVTDRFLNVKLSLLGSIAEDPAVIDATRRQVPYLSLFPSCKASMDIHRIAKRLSDSEAPREARGGLQLFFKQLVEYRMA